MHLRRQMFDEESQSLIDRLRINRVIVIQHKDEVIRDGGNFIEKGYQNYFG